MAKEQLNFYSIKATLDIGTNKKWNVIATYTDKNDCTAYKEIVTKVSQDKLLIEFMRLAEQVVYATIETEQGEASQALPTRDI